MTKKILWLSFLLLSILGSLIFLAITFKHGKFETNTFFIETFRMPSVFVMIVGTIAMVISTFAVQVLTRNRIADASIMGVSSVNYMALVIVYGASSVNTFINIQGYVMPIIYIASSIVTILFIFFLTIRYKKASEKIIVIGIVLSLTISAISSMVMANLPHDKQAYLSRMAIGELRVTADIYSTPTTIVALTITGIALLLLMTMWRRIRICYIDPVKAQTLGINVKLVDLTLILVTALGSTASFMEFGPIVFVGFVATNITHLIFKTFNFFKLFVSIVVGLILMFGVYVINTSLFNIDLNIGVMVNIIAIPYIILILVKGRNHARI